MPRSEVLIGLGSIQYWARIVLRIIDGHGDPDWTLAAATEGLKQAMAEYDAARAVSTSTDGREHR